MAIVFPLSPTAGDTVAGPDGQVWLWDSTKWTHGAAGSTGTEYLPLSGGQMTGPLLLSANATQNMEAVTYQQLQSAVGEMGHAARPTAPSSPHVGDLWLNTTNDTLYVWDGSDWITVGGASTGGVTSVTAGTGLSGGTITSSGTIGLITPISLANGGTGINAANNAALLSSLGAQSALANGTTAGQVLTWSGSAWGAAAPPSGGVGEYLSAYVGSSTTLNIGSNVSTDGLALTAGDWLVGAAVNVTGWGAAANTTYGKVTVMVSGSSSIQSAVSVANCANTSPIISASGGGGTYGYAVTIYASTGALRVMTSTSGTLYLRVDYDVGPGTTSIIIQQAYLWARKLA